MDHEKHFQEIFEEALEQKSLNHTKLALLTKIPERYIIAIQHQDVSKLPASPYIRGYLRKICEVLGLKFEDIWAIYENELEHKTSGAFDKLPSNRFALYKINKKSLSVGILISIILTFVSLNFNNLFGKPYLEIINPQDSLIQTSEPILNLTGRINPNDKLTINDKEVITDPDGNFETIYELQSGLNSIEFKVKKLLGKENSKIRQVIWEATTTEQLLTNKIVD